MDRLLNLLKVLIITITILMAARYIALFCNEVDSGKHLTIERSL